MLSDRDVRYITRNFRPLEELCASRGEKLARVEELIEGGRLPRPSYVLDDGTAMVPPDYFELLDAAGSAERLREYFISTYRQHDPSPAVAEQEWDAYLTGEYGACLRHVTPSMIVKKGRLMSEIEALIAEPSPTDAAWREQLSRSVNQLDELERDFADFDRIRFGGPVSRDRLITDVRSRYGL